LISSERFRDHPHRNSAQALCRA